MKKKRKCKHCNARKSLVTCERCGEWLCPEHRKTQYVYEMGMVVGGIMVCEDCNG